ncbi:MAG TPA: BPSS1780 family membrane protein [Steroidobacteraceae bacterium]
MNESRNPYAPPTAAVADTSHAPGAETFIPNGRSVSVGNGAKWMTQAFRLFFQTPGKWILVGLIMFGLSFASGLVPLGGVALTVFWPVLIGGTMYAIHQQRTTGTFEIGTIFSGFGPRLGRLAAVGALLLLNIPLLILVFAVVLGGDIIRIMQMTGQEADPTGMFAEIGQKGLLAFLIYLLFLIPLVAATYLAPALIVLHDLRTGEAMKMSFIGLMKNILPGIVFGALMLIAFLISILPIGLGLLIMMPVGLITTYTMYRNIFVEEEE